MSLIKDPNAIVRVRNRMTGDESHFMYMSQDGERNYHIAAGKVGEMRWKDWLEIQQYERARSILSLDENITVNEKGEVFLDGMDASEVIPRETVYEILALPLSSIETSLKAMKKANLLRLKEVAEEQGRQEALELIDKAIKSRGGRPRTKEA